jgi:hypothetical protein
MPRKTEKRNAAGKVSRRPAHRTVATKMRRPKLRPKRGRGAFGGKSPAKRAEPRPVIGRAQAVRSKVAAARNTVRMFLQKRQAVIAAMAAREEAVRQAFELVASEGPGMGEHTGDEEE